MVKIDGIAFIYLDSKAVAFERKRKIIRIDNSKQ